MTDAILIFTFSPVQSFIVEARRAADLYTGSQILVELARAAGKAIGEERLIYPASLAADVPNKLVARVLWDDCKSLADAAREALVKRWGELAQEARDEFVGFAPPVFDEFVWQRQIADAYLWETWWSAAHLLDGRKYQDAYVEAEQGLIAAKFTRPFEQALEPGFKDTLSGKRQALCGENGDGGSYWLAVGQIEKITPIKIRPSTEARPRERLDSIGLIKRFHPKLSEKAVPPFHGFPSTSSMASTSFLESARKVSPALENYRKAIASLLPERKYRIRDDDAWPYDGDLFYPETLHPKRLESDYGKKGLAGNPALLAAQKALNELYGALKKAAKTDPSIFTRPSPYYAIIVLDGDSMGERLSSLSSAEAHRNFSASLVQFADQAKEIAKEHRAEFIYNGGDDLLAMTPLDTAFSFTRLLSRAFQDSTKGITASAGIAFAHHLSPLSHALQTARRAEHDAKELDRNRKNAVCLIAIKRSGEPIEVRSGWDAVGEAFETLLIQFQRDEISSKLPYDLARSAYGLPTADEKLESELKRLLKRHGRTKDFRDNQADSLAKSLRLWASTFPEDLKHPDQPQPADQLAAWLALARFVAKGGRE